jgi:predicted nucleotidyltransferase
MGGGGGSGFSWKSPEAMSEIVRKTEVSVTDVAFETAVAEMLGQSLAAYNDRDTELVQSRLDEIKEKIGDEFEGAVDTLFGGSIAKRTYIDGLSDIDTIVIINKLDTTHTKPHDTLAYISELLQDRLPADAKVSHGRIAITIEYSDGMSIQLLPALRAEGGFKVPSWQSDNSWSEINPEHFQKALSKRNEECSRKLIPTIKLVKAINGTLPEEQRLSGYHIESLAISAFRGYEGPAILSKMLPYFFDKAKDLVLSPIKDRTGQSVHVDAYHGPENSAARVQASHILGRIAKRIRNANAAKSQKMWSELFNQ